MDEGTISACSQHRKPPMPLMRRRHASCSANLQGRGRSSVSPRAREGAARGRASHPRLHTAVKYAAQTASLSSIPRAVCYMLPNGMTERIDETTAYEPDALVYCGTKLASSDIEVPAPIIVVEVLSPSTRRIDALGQTCRLFPRAQRRPLSHRRSEQAVGTSSCARERGHDPHAHRDAGHDRARRAGIGGFGRGYLCGLIEVLRRI